MSITPKIKIRDLINNLNLFIKKFRYCDDNIQKKINIIINKYRDLTPEPASINLDQIRKLIEEISREISNCKSIEPTNNIYEIGWIPPDTYTIESERDYVQNIKTAYNNLNHVIRGTKNLLSNKDLITLLNFYLYHESDYWKNNLIKLTRDYKIVGTSLYSRKISLARRIYKLIFGKGRRITSGINKGRIREIPETYYFSIDRRKRFDKLSKQLDIISDMGFTDDVELLIKRIKEIKYYMKYLVYKNKYLKLKNLN